MDDPSIHDIEQLVHFVVDMVFLKSQCSKKMEAISQMSEMLASCRWITELQQSL